MSKKRVRKLKNSIIDISTVNIEHGKNYVNWINKTKEKLKEREQKLFIYKCSEIESILVGQNYKISNNIIQNVLNHKLFPVLDEWKGINLNRIKKELNTFKDYFVISFFVNNLSLIHI